MSAPLVTDGNVHAPFFVFARGGNLPTDQELLTRFDLGAYQAVDPSTVGSRPWIVIGHTDDWIVMADDWYYTLWHSERAAPRVGELATEWDVFTYRLPDADETFGFTFWRGESLVRSYELVQRDWTDPVTVEESGSPLDCEIEAFGLGQPDDRVRHIADRLGFSIWDAVGTWRVYAGPERKSTLALQHALTNIPLDRWPQAED